MTARNIRFVLTIMPREGEIDGERIRRIFQPTITYATYAGVCAAWLAIDPYREDRQRYQPRAVKLAKGKVSQVYFDTANNDDPELQRLDLACACLAWAQIPGDHGGNPYFRDFVRIAREIVGDV